MNGNSNIPNSWDDETNEEGMNNLSIGATPFVPNLNARAFVPGGFAKKPAAPAPVLAEPAPLIAPVASEPVVIEATTVVATQPEEPQVKEEPVAVEPEVEPVTEAATPVPTPVAAPVKKSKLAAVDFSTEDHLNVVFIGHVDAGKSTLGGQLMFLTGMVDKRTLEKYEREAKEKNRETWFWSWALDTNQEERDKGKTVEVGRAFFKTEKKHFTILDAPGHRSFVPNMIGGTSQADIAVLVISARKGEFETGFERGGQTREHAVLAKVAGVQRLVVLINKMDDTTVEWSEKRYNQCKDKLKPFLKKIGFQDKSVHVMPCSGFTGANLKEGQPDKHPYYTGLPFIPYLDSLPKIERSLTGPVRIPILDRYKDMGVLVLGKLESGTVQKQQQLILQPNKKKVKIGSILANDIEVESAVAGENVKLRLDGVDEDEISKGFVLCSINDLCNASSSFIAQIHIVEYKSIISNGFNAVIHLHSCVEEVTIKDIIYLVDKKGKRTKAVYVKQDQTCIARITTPGPVCVEKFADFPRMARFVLRAENITIAIGKVLKVE